MEIFRILLRTFIGYFILVAMLKIMGKREIGQLSLFDLIIFLSIADIMVIGIENYELNYLYVILPIILVTFLQKIIAKKLVNNLFFSTLPIKDLACYILKQKNEHRKRKMRIENVIITLLKTS